MVVYVVVVYALNGRTDGKGLALTVLAVGMAGAAMLVIAALERRHEAVIRRVQRRQAGEVAWLQRQAVETATALRQATAKQQHTDNEIAWLRGHVAGSAAATRPETGELAEYAGRADARLTAITGQLEHLLETLSPAKAPDASAVDQGLGDEPDREVLVYVGHRVHALVSRMLEHLKSTEREQEDPDLLDDLYRIDHLATQLRRAAEKLAVLGGHAARRAKSPMPISTVLRQAMAEVEDFTRVRLTLPDDEVEIPGYVGPDVIHVLAELVENATKFSDPTTTVLLSTARTPAGLSIEVRDQGLPLTAEKLKDLRRILAVPHRISPREQVRQGQIGLLVAARLAARHGLGIELHSDASGTRAVVVLPRSLLAVAPAPAPVAPTERAPLEPPHRAELPRRHRVATPSVPPAAPRPPSPPPGDKPALPRRSHAQPAAQPPADKPTGPASSPGRPPTPGLMGAFTAGVRDAKDDRQQNTPHTNEPEID
ncbi:sensor histidine kinase [Spirillospora sp. NPDC048823]|uniref:sensor histidine kinase n=1 Tax=unclassified Spirillospora TaxID=2642701 RepID=UPI00371FDB39